MQGAQGILGAAWQSLIACNSLQPANEPTGVPQKEKKPSLRPFLGADERI
jgi:hypothetical protein